MNTDSRALHEACDRTAAASPVASSQRVDLLDVLRGFALIGILLMNIEWFTRPIADLPRMDPTLTGIDYAAAWLVKIFVEGKFYKLFSLLFGMGFAVMLTRAEARGQPFAAMFARRMGALFVFGILHLVLLWGGDILHRYAVGGLLLLAWIILLRRPRLRRFDDERILLRLSLTLLALPFMAAAIAGFGYGLVHDRGELDRLWQQRLDVEARADALLAQAKAEAHATAPASRAEGTDSAAAAPDSPQALAARRAELRAEHERRLAEETAALTQPSFLEATRYRARDALRHLAEAPSFVFSPLLPIFLFGYWLIRSGVLHHPERHLPRYRVVAWLGLGAGFAISVAAYTLIAHPATRLIPSIAPLALHAAQLSQYLMTAGYVAVFVLAMQHPRWRPRLLGLAPLGRMALTHYLMHSVILGLLFYGYGLALLGEVPRASQLLLVPVIIGAQWAFSRYWLARFRHGPLEWVWRCITYWRWQPLRRPA